MRGWEASGEIGVVTPEVPTVYVPLPENVVDALNDPQNGGSIFFDRERPAEISGRRLAAVRMSVLMPAIVGISFGMTARRVRWQGPLQPNSLPEISA